MELRKELEDLLKTDVNIEQLEDNACVFTTKYMLFSYCKDCKEYKSLFIRLKEYHDQIPVFIFNQNNFYTTDNFSQFQSVYLEADNIYNKKYDIDRILNNYFEN